MREYAKVAPTFWSGETGKALRKRGTEGPLVALYLMSAPGSNMLGLYYQPVLFMAHETGLGVEGARKGLQDCIDVGFCLYDEDTEMVFVIEMAKWQVADSLKATDNRCAGLQREYESVPECPFLGLFHDRYAAAFHLTRRRSPKGEIEAPPKPLPSQEQEQEQEQAQDQDFATSDEVARTRQVDERQLSLVEGGKQKPWTPPDCPHLAVLALWAEVLPALPQHDAAQWKAARSDHLRARWRETAEEKRWPDQAAGLAFFRKLFAYVGKSQFLTGRARTAPGKRPFVVELEWLVKPLNWAKLIEGKYHQDAA